MRGEKRGGEDRLSVLRIARVQIQPPRELLRVVRAEIDAFVAEFDHGSATISSLATLEPHASASELPRRALSAADVRPLVQAIAAHASAEALSAAETRRRLQRASARAEKKKSSSGDDADAEGRGVGGEPDATHAARGKEEEGEGEEGESKLDTFLVDGPDGTEGHMYGSWVARELNERDRQFRESVKKSGAGLTAGGGGTILDRARAMEAAARSGGFGVSVLGAPKAKIIAGHKAFSYTWEQEGRWSTLAAFNEAVARAEREEAGKAVVEGKKTYFADLAVQVREHEEAQKRKKEAHAAEVQAMDALVETLAQERAAAKAKSEEARVAFRKESLELMLAAREREKLRQDAELAFQKRELARLRKEAAKDRELQELRAAEQRAQMKRDAEAAKVALEERRLRRKQEAEEEERLAKEALAEGLRRERARQEEMEAKVKRQEANVAAQANVFADRERAEREMAARIEAHEAEQKRKAEEAERAKRERYDQYIRELADTTQAAIAHKDRARRAEKDEREEVGRVAADNARAFHDEQERRKQDRRRMQREMRAILDAQVAEHVAAEVSGMDPVEERLNLSLLQRAEAYLKSATAKS